MAEDMIKQKVENKSLQLNQAGKKSKFFLLKENKGFYLLLENSCSLSEPPRSKRPGYKEKIQAEQKRFKGRLIILSGSFWERTFV